jgi:hypothetical protein
LRIRQSTDGLFGGRTLDLESYYRCHGDTFEAFLSSLEKIHVTDDEEIVEWDSLCSPEIGMEARHAEMKALKTDAY